MTKPPIDYIDTQGLSPRLTPEQAAKLKDKPQNHKPSIVTPRRLFTPMMVKELKILINEVLDEREHKKRMAGAYDNVKPLPPSYFDTKHFQHYVGEDEPPYEDWSQ
tara:strand:+ start:119 stop:436 length:318 start_codon:yes stop_codon:yes gene_type:complete